MWWDKIIRIVKQCCQGPVRCANLHIFPNPEPEPQVRFKKFRTLNLNQKVQVRGSAGNFFKVRNVSKKSNEMLTLHHFFSLAEEWMPMLNMGLSLILNSADYTP